MRILHYLMGLPPVYIGGMPKYALDLMKEQKKLGHEILLLISGVIKDEDSYGISIKKWRKYQDIDCYRIKNPIYISNRSGINQPEKFMPIVDEKIYVEWLNEVRPDIIHVHSVMGIHKEFFVAAKELSIKVVFTTHDYFGLCPKIDFMKDENYCDTNDWADCIRCCENATRLRRLKLEQTDFYRVYCSSKHLMGIVHSKVFERVKKSVVFFLKKCSFGDTKQNKYKISVEKLGEMEGHQKELADQYRALQKYYLDIFYMIDYYHFNSEQTKQVYESIIGKKNSQVIPVMNQSICDKRSEKQYGRTLRIGYLGTPAYMKGYYYLLQECQQLYESGRQGFYLNTYFWEICETQPFIYNHKPFTENQLDDVYADMDVLIVPSLWKETFGMVVLEALSRGVPVLLSENVGAKMFVEKYEGCSKIFSPQKGVLSGILQEIYDNRNMLEKMNLRILSAKMELDYCKNVEKVLELYNKACCS